MNNILNNKLNQFIDYQISIAIKDNDIKRLKALKEIASQRQFVDAPKGLSQECYNKWLRNAKKTFLLSLETESILMGDLHNYQNHSVEELNTKVFGSLTINEIIKILDSIDLYTIMYLVCGGVKVHDITGIKFHRNLGDIELYGDYYDSGRLIQLIAYPFSEFNRKLSYQPRNAIKAINGINAYEHLYRALRLPIGTVLGSINEVNTHATCDLEIDYELCDKIYKIQNDAPILIKK